MSLFFVKRKAAEYCEHPLNAKYTIAILDGIIEQLKKRNQVLLVFARRVTEEKQKPREANTCVSTRGSLPRFRMIALKRDSMCIYVVIAKSSREGRDATRRAIEDVNHFSR
jgi:hypothetical protein